MVFFCQLSELFNKWIAKIKRIQSKKIIFVGFKLSILQNIYLHKFIVCQQMKGKLMSYQTFIHRWIQKSQLKVLQLSYKLKKQILLSFRFFKVFSGIYELLINFSIQLRHRIKLEQKRLLQGLIRNFLFTLLNQIYILIFIIITMDYLKNQQMVDNNKKSENSQIQDDLQDRFGSESQLILHLEESKRVTLNFIQNLNEKALTPISQTILDHYNGEINPLYTLKDIQSMVDKRISKMIRNKKVKKNWNLQDIILLLWFVSKYIETNQEITPQNLTNQDWIKISKLIPGSTPKGCMFKFVSLKKVKLSVFSWEKQEQDILRSLVRKWGLNKWKQISEYLYENNIKQKIFRTPKQCRQHWNCYLDPKLKKGPWSQEQDIKLLKNVFKNKGQKKWSAIKYLFQGRTQNALKNRFNLLLQRQRKIHPDKKQNQLIVQYLKSKSKDQSSEQKQVQLIQDYSNIKDEIYEEYVDVKNSKYEQKIETIREIQSTQNIRTILKHQKSSFRVAENNFQQRIYNEGFQDNKFQHSKIYVNSQQIINDDTKRYMVVSQPLKMLSISTTASIYTNQQGFYSNIFYNRFYSS